jgi:hypothetical protein
MQTGAALGGSSGGLEGWAGFRDYSVPIDAKDMREVTCRSVCVRSHSYTCICAWSVIHTGWWCREVTF